MTFFNSEMVRAEMTEISQLQEEVYGNVFKFHSMDNREKIKHVNLLKSLLEKQRVLYTRMSLSDDPEAQEMKNKIIESAKMMGLQDDTNVSQMFGKMEKLLESLMEELDRS